MSLAEFVLIIKEQRSYSKAYPGICTGGGQEPRCADIETVKASRGRGMTLRRGVPLPAD